MAEQRVAKRYAKALFNTALKLDILSSVSDDLTTVTTAIRNSDGFREFLHNPRTSDTNKLTIFEKTFGDKITATTLSFIKLLIKKRRDDEITGVKIAFDELRRNHEQVIRAIIESSSELDDKQKKAVVAKIEEATGKKLETEFAINPELIMGVKVTYGDYVLDGSVRGQLNRMKERLLYDVLKQA